MTDRLLRHALAYVEAHRALARLRAEMEHCEDGCGCPWVGADDDGGGLPESEWCAPCKRNKPRYASRDAWRRRRHNAIRGMLRAPTGEARPVATRGDHERMERFIAAALAEAEERGFEAGIASVLAIRCTCHHSVPPLNASGQGGGECAACAHERGQAEGIARERRGCWEIADRAVRAFTEPCRCVAEAIRLAVETRGPMEPEL